MAGSSKKIKWRPMALAILKAYGLRPRRMSLLQAERQWTVEVVGQGRRRGRFCLRIYYPPAQAVDFARSQAQWLHALHAAAGLPVPEPIAAEDGDFIVAPTGRVEPRGSFGLLTRWVPGKPRLRKNGPGTDVLRQVGRLMARMHSHSELFEPPRGFRCPMWNYDGLFGRQSQWRPTRPVQFDRQTTQLFASIQRRARDAMELLGTGRDVFGLLHGDLIQTNYVVSRGAVGAIDFGDFGRGHFLYDMAITLLMLKPFDKTGRQREAFIRGYRQVRAFAARHEELLDLFIACRAVLLAKWFSGSIHPMSHALRWVQHTIPWLKEV